MRRLAAVSAMIASVTLIATAHAGETKQPDPGKKICRTERGSHSLAQRKRICRTRAEWDQLETEGQKAYKDLQTLGTATIGPTGSAMLPNSPM